MTPDKSSSSAGLDDGQFDRTRWSLVSGAVQSRAPCAQKALAEFCGLYWRPLCAFAQRRGRSPEDAQDLVRGFFEHLIGTRGLATVKRSTGRFRSFLLAFLELHYGRKPPSACGKSKNTNSSPTKEFLRGIGQFSSLNSISTEATRSGKIR